MLNDEHGLNKYKYLFYFVEGKIKIYMYSQ